jgi:hypothetical protein
MTLEQAENLSYWTELVEDIIEDYSGRFMYGSETAAIIVNFHNKGELIKALQDNIEHEMDYDTIEELEDLIDVVEGLRVDNMALQYVMY